MAIVLLTGASSGLGAALAPVMARRGHTVILTARRKEMLDALAAQINAEGGTAIAMAMDVCDGTAVQATVAQIEADHGPVDILVANAGIGAETSALAWKTEQVAKVFDVNVLGVSRCIEAVLPSMVARKSGQLVAVASLAGYRGLPASGAYAASKAAVISMMESLRIELQEHDVAVTVLCPGFVKTPLTAGNSHSMPFLMEVEKAAVLMDQAIHQKKSEFAFPWQLASVVRVSKLLPNRLYDRALRGRKAQKSLSDTNQGAGPQSD